MSESNKVQIDYWNGRAGEKWSALHENLDAMLANVTTELTARVGAVSGQNVLDIGCGTGETCAVWLENGAKVTGVDVSSPMLEVAAIRTNRNAILIEADASVWKGDSTFDLAVSRFGVMFFADPYLAFTNIAANLRAEGRLVFTCWRAFSENQWANMPISAIKDLLPPSAPPIPHAPGPFGLADKERLREILNRAGFVDIKITPYDFPVCLAREGGVTAAVNFAMQIGPAGAALAEVNEEGRAKAKNRLTVALNPFDKDGVVTLDGAIWIVEAMTVSKREFE